MTCRLCRAAGAEVHGLYCRPCFCELWALVYAMNEDPLERWRGGPADRAARALGDLLAVILLSTDAGRRVEAAQLLTATLSRATAIAKAAA
jgi:hypothetical protein